MEWNQNAFCNDSNLSDFCFRRGISGNQCSQSVLMYDSFCYKAILCDDFFLHGKHKCLTNKQIFLLAVKWFVVDIFGCVLQQCQTVSLALRLIMENMASINLVLFCLCLATIIPLKFIQRACCQGCGEDLLNSSSVLLRASCMCHVKQPFLPACQQPVPLIPYTTAKSAAWWQGIA